MYITKRNLMDESFPTLTWRDVVDPVVLDKLSQVTSTVFDYLSQQEVPLKNTPLDKKISYDNEPNRLVQNLFVYGVSAGAVIMLSMAALHNK